ncbi:MAG: hypothetical protein KDA41_19785, partial [Planctomycetales bacterium]|nr:hypothetical protein [Planctomycetales bacterium]
MTIGFVVLADGATQVLTDIAELRQVWPQNAQRVWIDLESPSDETLREAGEIFSLDEESLSDCAYGEQRPRVDEFDNYIFMVLY